MPLQTLPISEPFSNSIQTGDKLSFRDCTLKFDPQHSSTFYLGSLLFSVQVRRMSALRALPP